YADRAIRQANAKGIAIGVGIRADRLEAERVACADDADGDFAAIRDEDPAQRTPRRHHCVAREGSMTISGASVSTGAPFSTNICATTPRAPAGIEFISFITSMLHTVVSGSTACPTSTKGAAPGSGDR